MYKLSPCVFPVFVVLLCADAVHAAVQSTRQAEASEMVRSPVRQGEEEDHQRAGPDHPRQKAQNVQLLGVEGRQDRLQEVSEMKE